MALVAAPWLARSECVMASGRAKPISPTSGWIVVDRLLTGRILATLIWIMLAALSIPLSKCLLPTCLAQGRAAIDPSHTMAVLHSPASRHLRSEHSPGGSGTETMIAV